MRKEREGGAGGERRGEEGDVAAAKTQLQRDDKGWREREKKE